MDGRYTRARLRMKDQATKTCPSKDMSFEGSGFVQVAEWYRVGV